MAGRQLFQTHLKLCRLDLTGTDALNCMTVIMVTVTRSLTNISLVKKPSNIKLSWTGHLYVLKWHKM